MRYVIGFFAMVLLATPATAQPTYIGGSVAFDIARFDKIEFDNDLPRITGTAASTDGEAVGFNLRIGRALGERWGLEFEFARSGEINNQVSYTIPFFTDLTILPPGLPIPPIPFQYELEVDQRYTSYGAWGWVRQDLGERVDFTYLAGLLFNHAELEQNVRVTDPRFALWSSVIPDQTLTEYSISPAVGFEAAFKLNDAAAITGGLRLHEVTAGRTGLLVRPNVGVRWAF